MHQHQQVIQLARQSALKNFSVLVQRMAQNSDQELAKALSVNSATTDYRAVNAARHFLRKAGDDLLKSLETQYRQKLEQALHAMYSDEHVDLVNIAATSLSLIDDQTINRQIEVGHLVGRLSASCSECLGQVTFIISQLLEKPDIKEKDNPFRPELIARTLHSVLCTMVEDERVRNFLLNYATNSLAIYLPDYYLELCEVFKAGGVSPKMYTRPTSRNRPDAQHGRPTSEQRHDSPQVEAAQHYAGEPGKHHADAVATGFSPDMLPTLQRLLNLMQQAAPIGQVSGEQVNVSPLVAFQGLINNLLGSSGSYGTNSLTGQPQNGMPNIASADLLSRLNELQLRAAGATGADSQSAVLHDQIDTSLVNHSERMALDLIAVLFELMHRDDQIPENLRNQIGRLQIPFLKSAVLDPGTLQQLDHPTRQLLNHMGMVSVGAPTESHYGQEVGVEIKRIVKKILEDFQQDNGIFVNCLDELKKFMEAEMRHGDALTKRHVEAIEAAQRVEDLTYRITTSVSEILLPLKIEQSVVNFCLQKWVHVLVKASIKFGSATDDDSKSARLQVFFNALPDLVWSVQDKVSTEERLALIRLLPKLVKIIKSGLKALQLTDEESRQELDELLAVHARVLANTDNTTDKKLPTLSELRQMFRFEAIQEEANTSKAVAPTPLDGSGIKAALAKKGVDANLHIKPVDGYASKVEHEWLAEMQVGTRVECEINGACQFGRLVWVAKNRALFMFRLDKSPNPLIYCPVSLSQALSGHSITFVETAPTFERAVESLLQEAEILKKIAGPT